MNSRRWCSVLRVGAVLCLGAMLLLPVNCGVGYEGGRRPAQLVGGALRPNELAYELTTPSDEIVPVGSQSDLPTSVDLRRDGIVPPVQNQHWNDCVAWSLGYYVMSAVEARRMRNLGVWLDMTDSENWFAPDFIYSQRDETADQRMERAPGAQLGFDMDGEVGCMRPERALDILVSKGCCHWHWMCGQTASEAFRSCDPAHQDAKHRKSRRPWGPASVDAMGHRARCYVRFGAELDELEDGTISRMREWLAPPSENHPVRQGTPIAIIVKMTSGWMTYGGQNRAEVVIRRDVHSDVKEVRGVCLSAGGEDLGGQHMMTVIGYDDHFPSPEQYNLPAEMQGSFLIVNQWGEKWGDRGYMWIPYAELRRIWIGGYGLVREEGGESVGSGECAQDETGRYVNICECDDVPMNLNVDGDAIVPTATSLLELPVDGCGSMAGAAPPAHGVRVTVCGRVGSYEATCTCGTPDQGRDPADWFYFKTTGDMTDVELSLKGKNGANLSGDIRLKLTDEKRTLIAESRVDEAKFPLIAESLCAQGAYFVKVYPYYAGHHSAYELTVTLCERAPSGDGDTVCDPTPITLGPNGPGGLPGAQNWGKVGDGDPVDWWSFQVPRASRVVVTLRDLGNLTADDSLDGGYRLNLGAFRGAGPNTKSRILPPLPRAVPAVVLPYRTLQFEAIPEEWVFLRVEGPRNETRSYELKLNYFLAERRIELRRLDTDPIQWIAALDWEHARTVAEAGYFALAIPESTEVKLNLWYAMSAEVGRVEYETALYRYPPLLAQSYPEHLEGNKLDPLPDSSPIKGDLAPLDGEVEVTWQFDADPG